MFRFPSPLPLLLTAVFLQHPLTALAGEFKVGAAQVDITPPVGTPRGGAYATVRTTGLLDSLFAKAIVVEQNGEKAAFVALDVVGTPRALVVATRKLIAAQTGIAGDRVMISATHTHSGPVLPRDSMMDDVQGGKSPLIVDYMAKFPALIAQAVADANAKLAPATASAALGHEENISYNRRFVMKDGSYEWHRPKQINDLLRPAGPIDPEVGVLHLASAGRVPVPLATYVNFAMHANVIGGNRLSADYPAYLAKRLADYFGPDMVTFFANGCCGNIGHINPHWTTKHTATSAVERVGTVLAAAVFRTLPNLTPLTTSTPRVRSQMVTLQRRTFSESEIAEARRNARRISDPALDIPARAKVVCVLDTVAQQGTPLEAEVQVIALSDELAIVALPGEMFVELGLALKKASPFKHTFIAELANGSIGYIPNRSAFAEGLYEVISTRAVEGSGERLIETALELLRQLAKP